jgi:hypothetical protein
MYKVDVRVFRCILCSVGQFSPWFRFWSNRMEITSFNGRGLAFLAVTVFWSVRCHVNSLYLSVVTEFSDMDVAQFKACITCTATIDRDQVPSLSSSDGFTYPLFIYSNTNPNLITFLTLILGTKVPSYFYILDLNMPITFNTCYKVSIVLDLWNAGLMGSNLTQA